MTDLENHAEDIADIAVWEAEALLVKLEAATEGSEQLDVAFTKFLCGYGPEDPIWHTLKWTRSVDDALVALPKGHLWQIKHGIEVQAIIWSLEKDYADLGAPCGAHESKPALAFCIAAVKAKLAEAT